MNAQKHYASIWEQKWTEIYITKLDRCTHKSLSEGKEPYVTVMLIPRTIQEWGWLERNAKHVHAFCLAQKWEMYTSVYLTNEYLLSANSVTHHVWDLCLTNRACVSCKSGWNYSNENEYETAPCGTCKPFKIDRQIFVSDMILPIIIASIHEQLQTDLQKTKTKPTDVEQTFFDCYIVKNIIWMIYMM